MYTIRGSVPSTPVSQAGTKNSGYERRGIRAPCGGESPALGPEEMRTSEIGAESSWRARDLAFRSIVMEGTVFAWPMLAARAEARSTRTARTPSISFAFSLAASFAATFEGNLNSIYNIRN